MIHPLFFSPCEWEVAQFVSIHATTRPRHLYHTALAENGDHILEHWIGKNSEESGFPCIIASEFICAQLATELGLSVPECQVQWIVERLWFLSYYIRSEAFTYRKFLRCRNIRDVPLLLLFDLWVCNRDRWSSNLLLSRLSDAPDSYEFVVIDHSDALFSYVDVPRVTLDIDPQLCFAFTELGEQIRGDNDWDSALSKLGDLNDEVIVAAVNTLPAGACPTLDTGLLIEQLIRRKRELPQLLWRSKTKRCFPNWV